MCISVSGMCSNELALIAARWNREPDDDQDFDDVAEQALEVVAVSRDADLIPAGSSGP